MHKAQTESCFMLYIRSVLSILCQFRTFPQRLSTVTFHCYIIQLTRKHKQPTSHDEGSTQGLLLSMLKTNLPSVTFRCIPSFSKCKSIPVLCIRREDLNTPGEDLTDAFLTDNSKHGTMLQVDLLMTNTSSMWCNRAQSFCREWHLYVLSTIQTQNILSPKMARYNNTDRCFLGKCEG